MALSTKPVALGLSIKLNRINSNELFEILDLIISYLYRRVVCSYPTNALNKIFASMSKSLELSSTSNDYDTILKTLMSKTSSGTFPRDEEFRNAFIKLDLYKSKIDRYTLFQLERTTSRESVPDNDTITIEHIMPQRLTDEWKNDLGSDYDQIYNNYLHTVGNLTLTAYNSDMSNRSFGKKKVFYSTSNISICRSVCDYAQWNEDSILDRAEKLFESAKKIWQLPQGYETSDYLHTEIDYSNEYNILDNLNVQGEKPRELIILDKHYQVNKWKDTIVTLASILYELDRDTFEKLVDNPELEGRSRKIISKDKANMMAPIPIANEFFIETNLNANATYYYCGVLARQYDLQDDVSLLLREKEC